MQKSVLKELIRQFYRNPDRWLIATVLVCLTVQTVMLISASSLVHLGSTDRLQQLLDLLTGTAVASFAATLVAIFAIRKLNGGLRETASEMRNFLRRVGEYSYTGETNAFDELRWMSTKVTDVAGAVIEREAAIADHSLDLLLSMNGAAQIVAINQASLRHVRQHPYQLLYKHISSLIQQDDMDVFQQAMSRAAATAGQVEVAAEVKIPDEPPRVFLWTIEFSSTHKTYFCAGKDVTEKMQLERFKQDFTSMVVHDLRSPISSAVMTIQLILSDGWEPLADSHRVQLSRCLRGMDRLLSLINSLLDLSKLEAGKFKLQIELLRLSRIVEESIATVGAYAQQRQVKIESKGTLDEKVAVDEERIVQVLINLLSNAIKYSPRDGTVTLTAYKGERMVTVIVTDEGPGIPEEHKQRIFERYEQMGHGEQVGTTGLGLFICRAIVERHGGNIGVRSEIGMGSQFWFTIPCISNNSGPDPDLDFSDEDETDDITL